VSTTPAQSALAGLPGSFSHHRTTVANQSSNIGPLQVIDEIGIDGIVRLSKADLRAKVCVAMT
jgi:hypothetical protein